MTLYMYTSCFMLKGKRAREVICKQKSPTIHVLCVFVMYKIRQITTIVQDHIERFTIRKNDSL